jgi:hypothetical protein
MDTPLELNRRKFLKAVGIAGIGQLVLKGPGAVSTAYAEPSAPAAGNLPFRVIFNNDTTNIISCTSPYHKRGEDWTPQMLEASVDEVAGKTDVHCLSMAHGSVPWYQSKVYPMAEHMRWWKDYFKADPWHDAFQVAPVHRFIVNGGDVLQVFIDRCRKTGQTPFVSMRLNDAHHVENINTPGNIKGIHAITRFYVEHPEWRIGTDLSSWLSRTLNWAVPQVRERIFSLISEQCLNYDIDGFEMDFMRIPSFFRQNETSFEQRRAIMTEFVGRVRKVLDQGSRGKRRWLSARIPCYLTGFDPLGIDLKAWSDAGLDIANVSPSFYTVQQTDLPRMKEMVPSLAFYQEMCHTTWTGPEPKGAYDSNLYRRATPEQLETTAHLAYSHGATGVSYFNFVYYREEGYFIGDRGPFNEPPFWVMKKTGDPKYLAGRSQHWFAAPGYKAPWGGMKTNLPQKVTTGKAMTLTLDLAPPAGGWGKDGRLRIQSYNDLRGSVWSARLNGQDLSESENRSEAETEHDANGFGPARGLVNTANRSEPFPNPYPPMLGRSYELRAWLVPANAIKLGANLVEVALVKANESVMEPSGYEIPYCDLAMPVSGELQNWIA